MEALQLELAAAQQARDHAMAQVQEKEKELADTQVRGTIGMCSGYGMVCFCYSVER